MKRLFLLFLFVLNAALPTAVHAEKADSGKPVVMDADQIDHDNVKQIYTLNGNAIITRGTMVLKAGKVVLSVDPAGYTFATLFGAPGTAATFRQKRDGGPDLWMEGEAERIEYDGKTEVIKLITRAKVRQLEGTKATEEADGAFIAYDSRAEFFTVANTPEGASKAGAGRTRIVIQPTTDQKGK